MKTKVLVIGVVKKGNSILMRKKPDGSLPYKETWYLFGGELFPEISPELAIVKEVKNNVGIDIKLVDKLSWDTEVKHDIDGEEKLFIYLDTVCESLGGDLILSDDIEKLEWVPINKLSEYDIVPPSKKLLQKIGYL